MHPEVCAFISDIVYEGRLTSDEGTKQQRIFGSPSRHLSGAHLVQVPHFGNSQTSPEEVAAIRCEIEFLIGKTFRDRDGIKRALGLSDILVVAPYTLQANTLRPALPLGTTLGTLA